MNAEVLVVDDDPRAAATFARYVQAKTRLRTLSTDDVAKALELVRDQHVKVVILDQRMEQKSNITGTELARRIGAVDRRVRCIIFSGQSEKEDVEEAGELNLIYRDKSRLEELPNLVHTLRAEYLEDLAHQDTSAILASWEVRSGGLFGGRVRFELIAIEDVSGEEAYEEDYREILLLTPARTTMTYSTKDSSEREIRQEDEVKKDLALRIAVKPAVFGELDNHLSNELSRRNAIRISRRNETDQQITFSLTKKDVDDGIVACSIRQAPLYIRRRAILRATCSCCGVQSTTGFIFPQWTGRYDRRRIDRFADGRTREIPLGPD